MSESCHEIISRNRPFFEERAREARYEMLCEFVIGLAWRGALIGAAWFLI